VAKKETLKLSGLENKERVILYTIASSESDIRLCMMINKAFRVSMSLSDDLLVSISSEYVRFKRYQFEDDTEGEKFILLINRHPSGKFLLPEFKKIDYILIISTSVNEHQFDDAIRTLKENNGISAIFKIEHKSVRSFKRIIL
jgi:hypothetical protein